MAKRKTQNGGPGTATIPDRWRPRPVVPAELPFGPTFYEMVIDELVDGVYFVDRARRLLFWSKGAERISGHRSGDVLGSFCYAGILDHVDASGCHLCKTGCPLVSAMTRGESGHHRVFLKHADGHRVAVDVSVMPVRDTRGRIVGGVEVFRDATAALGLEHAYAQARDLAGKDALTGLANRRQLDDMLGALVRQFRERASPFSVVMGDIDHFKSINDTHGHHAGDLALKRFAAVLQSSTRASDVAGRFGGEEFLVLLPGYALDAAVAVAERIRAAVADSRGEAADTVRMTASFGVAEAIPGDDATTLLSRADAALYRAKTGGRNRVDASQGP